MYKPIFLSFLFLIIGISLQAQDYLTTKTVSKKIKDKYSEAYKEMIGRQPEKGEKLMLKVIRKAPKFVNPYLLLADYYRAKKDKKKALEYFGKALEIAPDYDPRVYYSLGSMAMNEEDYTEAAKQFEKFLSYDKTYENLTVRAKKMLGDARFRPKALANPVPFDPKNMGEAINSARRDYFPSITADENTFVYTVQKGQGRTAQEDLHVSFRKDGEWQKSFPIPGINTTENEAAQSISADGKLLVFTVCNRRQDFGSCDLYFSELVNGKWTEPQNIGEPINSARWESQPSVAPDGKAIYFTRGGARGQGHRDLYVSYRQPDGSWGKPQNIKELNTLLNEGAPHIHPDGQTMYFSSNGHAGMGSYDLFISRRQPDGSWGEPQNLGYPINSPKSEEALAVQLNGKLAYIASDREGGFGSLDIYQFVLPESVRPKPVTYARMQVIDAKTKERLKAHLEVIDLETDKAFVDDYTDKDGEFLVCLPVGKDYALNVNKKRYVFHSENFALKKATHEPYLLKIALQPIEETPNVNVKPKPITLKNVFFETASAELKSTSKTELNKLKSFLEEQPNIRIQLNGHTDNVGKPEDNLKLSKDRAKAVKDYLIEQGIAAERLESEGFGETKPIASNETAEGRALNRRTTFMILR